MQDPSSPAPGAKGGGATSQSSEQGQQVQVHIAGRAASAQLANVVRLACPVTGGLYVGSNARFQGSYTRLK
jgi:hypothetical protein